MKRLTFAALATAMALALAAPAIAADAKPQTQAAPQPTIADLDKQLEDARVQIAGLNAALQQAKSLLDEANGRLIQFSAQVAGNNAAAQQKAPPAK